MTGPVHVSVIGSFILFILVWIWANSAVLFCLLQHYILTDIKHPVL